MTGKVFLSCGQRLGREKKMANKIKKLLKDKFNLDCYVAIEIQGFNDIMKITDELRSSDYYLFIDFYRESDKFPTSLFTHQEFALAHHLGFKDMIAFKEKQAPFDGFIKYVQSNPEPFTSDEELLKKVEKFIKQKNWNKEYSRNMILDVINVVGPIQYKDHTGIFLEYIWHAKILNQRPDVAAVNAVCILDYIEFPNGQKKYCDDRSYLKWANQIGYQRTILPEDYGIIDLFSLHSNQQGIFLHSARDLIPRNPMSTQQGVHKFHYKVFSENFPLLKFCVEINYQPSTPQQTNWSNNTTTKII